MGQVNDDSINRFGKSPGAKHVAIQFLTETENFVIYKGDTFNKRDSNGLIQGKGILIIKDSLISETWGSSGPHCNGGCCTFYKYRDSDVITYEIREVFYGQFKDNVKAGIWTSYSTNGKHRTEIHYDNNKVDRYVKYIYKNGNLKLEIPYFDDKVDGEVKIYYSSGELMYSGQAKHGQDKIVLTKYSKSGLQSQIMVWFVSDIESIDT